MDWLQYVIPLIVVVVYVVSHIVSAYQEQQRQQEEAERRRRGTEQPSVASSDEETEGRRLDLDRRTEEARGLREELVRAEEARPRAEEAPPVSRYASEDEVAARVPPPATKVHWRAPKPVVMPVIPPVPAPPPPVVIPVAAVVAGRPTSPVARQVVAFLRDRNSLAAALLLKEVLDPPLSRRPRRHG